MKDGTIDLYGEYTGTLLTFLKGEPTGDSKETYDLLTTALAEGRASSRRRRRPRRT